MTTDHNDLAITTNPNNSNEDVLYSVSGGWWRAIPTSAFLTDLSNRGIPTASIDSNIWAGIKGNQHTDW